jgi:hypothetical protein
MPGYFFSFCLVSAVSGTNPFSHCFILDLSTVFPRHFGIPISSWLLVRSFLTKLSLRHGNLELRVIFLPATVNFFWDSLLAWILPFPSGGAPLLYFGNYAASSVLRQAILETSRCYAWTWLNILCIWIRRFVAGSRLLAGFLETLRLMVNAHHYVLARISSLSNHMDCIVFSIFSWLVLITSSMCFWPALISRFVLSVGLPVDLHYRD